MKIRLQLSWSKNKDCFTIGPTTYEKLLDCPSLYFVTYIGHLVTNHFPCQPYYEIEKHIIERLNR